MSTDARDQLADLIWRVETRDLRVMTRSDAEAILGRFAVVELPEPDGEDDDGQVYFADFDIRVDTTGRHGYTAHLTSEVSREIDAELLRRRAASYLAAARLLEEGGNR